MKALDPALLPQILLYEPETGKLFWRVRTESLFAATEKNIKRSCAVWNVRYANKEALSRIGVHGYPSGTIFNKGVLAHRVIWALVTGEWPPGEIDHIDGNRANNRFDNLRAVTRRQNAKNIGKMSTNTSGVKGVCWHRVAKKWLAQINVDCTHIHLGLFTDITDAAKAYERASEEMHGNFRRMM